MFPCVRMSFLIYLSFSNSLYLSLIGGFSNSCQIPHVLCLLLAKLNSKVRFNLFHIKRKNLKLCLNKRSTSSWIGLIMFKDVLMISSFLLAIMEYTYEINFFQYRKMIIV